MKESEEVIIGKNLPEETISDKKVELARHLFASLEAQIQVADRKVQAVFSLNAFLVAAISLQSQETLNAIISKGFTWNVIVELTFKAVFLACVCVATLSAVRALSPRLRKNHIITDARKKSLFFFGDITSQTPNEFFNTFLSLTNEEAVKELLASAHSVSGILALKYKLLKRSMLCLSLALLIWVLIQVNKFLC